VVGVGGLFGPPAENFGMTSTTFFYPPACSKKETGYIHVAHVHTRTHTNTHTRTHTRTL